jgi:hypothetical protein
MSNFTLTDIIQSALHTVIIHVLFQAFTAAKISIYEQCKPKQQDEYKKNEIKTKADIPLCLVKDDTQVQYVSAIALKLSASWNISTANAANVLCNTATSPSLRSDTLNVETQDSHASLQTTAYLSAKLLPYFTVEQSSSGWIRIRVSNAGVVDWLAYLFETLPLLSEATPQAINTEDFMFSRVPSSLRNSTELFHVHHTLTRCQSLLHLATITKPDKSRYSASDQSTSTLGGNLIRLETRQMLASYAIAPVSVVDYPLIRVLIHTFDEVSILPMPSIENWRRYLRVAHRLSAAVQQFYRQVQVGAPEFGTDADLRAFRVNLIHLCSVVLRSLLTEGLGIPACSEF